MEKPRMKILICDDKPEQNERTISKLESRGDLTSLSGNDLKRDLTSFFKKISEFLSNTPRFNQAEDACVFDGYDLAIVDNNLTSLELEGVRLTAETIIGYLRAFTNIPYFVSLNKNLFVDFDLRYLYGDYDSLADMALNTEHLSNNWLWGNDQPRDFSPWYWPQLPQAVNRRRKQISFLEKNFDSSVWDTLGFPDSSHEYLSQSAKEILSSEEETSYRETTFHNFFKRSHTLQPAEIENLFNNKAEKLVKKALCRITSYEVDRWLRRDVLGTQDVLIDVPHLLAQMPFLLGAKSSELHMWNRTVSSDKAPFHLDEELFEQLLKKAQFKEGMWAPKPCFWWSDLKNNDDLMQAWFDVDENWPDAVFCEDLSQFVQIDSRGNDYSPKEVEPSIEGSWGRRFIALINEVSYSPRSRILEKEI